MEGDETISSLCEEFINGQREESSISKELAKDISTGFKKLLSLVEALGIYLTSADISKRIRGTKLLSSVLSQLFNHLLLEDEVSYLVSFYCDRLKDSPLVTPHVLEGLLALTRFQKIGDKDVVNIVRGLFGEIHNQALQQTSRNMFYSIMIILLKSYGSVINQISSEFLLGFIQAMDGEKDPRNLLIIFDTIPLLTKHCVLDVLVEELFEVVSCYFPINFNPSSSDPKSVSKEELVLGLRKCLIATPKFAEFCLPLLLDKMSSDLLSAKEDAILTLTDSMSAFGSSFISSYIPMIWANLKREIFYPLSEDVESASLLALTELCKILTDFKSTDLSSDDSLQQFIHLINKDIHHHICELELRLIKPAVSVIAAISKGSLRGGNIISNTYLPLLVKQLEIQTQISKKQTVMECILLLLQSFKTYSTPENGLTSSDYYVSLLSLCLSTLTDNHTHTTLSNVVIVTIAALISLQCLPDKEVNTCVDALINFIFSSNIGKELCQQCIQTLGLISQLYSQIIINKLLPSLLTSIHQPEPGLSISIMTTISTSYEMIVKTLPELVELLKETCDRYNYNTVLLASESISAIITTITTATDSTKCMRFIHDSIVPTVLKICINSVLTSDQSIIDEVILSHIGSSLHHHCLALEEQISIDWSEKTMNFFMTGTDLLFNPNNHQFQPLKADSPWRQTQMVSLLTSVLSSAPCESLKNNGQELLSLLVELSLQCTHTYSHLWAARACHCIINKINEDKDSVQLIEHSLDTIWRNIIDTKSNEERCRALTLWLWIVKGLIMRSHHLGVSSVKKLFELFGDQVTARRAADGFYLLLIDSSQLLARGNIRLFYKQQVFSYCVPELITLFQLSKENNQSLVKESVLYTLSHLMSSVPKQVLLPELQKLFPLLLESIHTSSSSEMGVVLSSCEAIYSLVLDAPSIMGQHVTSLIKPIINIAQTSPFMKVRISALRCIGVLTTLPTYLVYPYQSLVIRELAPCLDDKKRLVRKEAVTSRSEWYMLGIER